MLNLTALNVSLTKHGAHKVAILLQKYDKDEVLNRLWDTEPDINIDAAQARKTLAVDAAGNVPVVWSKARAMGIHAINALTLVSIIFSHHRLIEAMRRGKIGFTRGRINRGDVIAGKEFTNFAYTVQELGFSEIHTADYVTYNLKPLFEIPRLNQLVIELLEQKFRGAVWNQKKPLAEEFLESKLNEVFAISADKCRSWLVSGNTDALTITSKDEAFLEDVNVAPASGSGFKFKQGHNPKKTGTVTISPPSGAGKAELLHNKLQTLLYEKLIKEFGERRVGTEQSTGHGTSIDLVVKTKEFCWFYEIKVASSARACVRQALPQLLEYAYWRQDKLVVDRLYVAAKLKPTAEVTEYLALLRKRFGLPIFYLQIPS